MVIYGIYAQVVGRSKSTKIYVGQWTETKGERRTVGERKKGDKTLEKGQEISSGKKNAIPTS